MADATALLTSYQQLEKTLGDFFTSILTPTVDMDVTIMSPGRGRLMGLALITLLGTKVSRTATLATVMLAAIHPSIANTTVANMVNMTESMTTVAATVNNNTATATMDNATVSGKPMPSLFWSEVS